MSDSTNSPAMEPPTRIDPEALDRVLRLGGTALLERLVQVAEGNVRDRLDELDQALARQPPDLENAQRACHSMKSSAAYLGLSALRDLAASMESDARGMLTDSASDSAIAATATQTATAKAVVADELRRRRRQIPALLSAGLEALRREIDARR